MSNKSKGAGSGAASGAASGAMAGAAFGPYGVAIGAVVGGIAGALGGSLTGGAADDAEKLAEMQAEFTMVENERNIEVMKDAADFQLGSAKAAVAGSDILLSGSSRLYINDMNSKLTAYRVWQDYAARMNARMQLKGGQAAADSIMSSMYNQQISQVASAAVSFGAGKFGSPTGSGTMSGSTQYGTGGDGTAWMSQGSTRFRTG